MQRPLSCLSSAAANLCPTSGAPRLNPQQLGYVNKAIYCLRTAQCLTPIRGCRRQGCWLPCERVWRRKFQVGSSELLFWRIYQPLCFSHCRCAASIKTTHCFQAPPSRWPTRVDPPRGCGVHRGTRGARTCRPLCCAPFWGQSVPLKYLRSIMIALPKPCSNVHLCGRRNVTTREQDAGLCGVR